MTQKAPIDEIRDYAIGYLLIDFATLDPKDVGSAVSDEELSVFVEPNAKDHLGEHRCQQILTQISQNKDLYQRWLLLIQSAQLDGPFATLHPAEQNTVNVHSIDEQTFAWKLSLHSILKPRLNMAAAALLIAFTSVATHWLSKQNSTRSSATPPILAVNPGEELPRKASQSHIDSAGTTDKTDASQRLLSRLKCSSSDDTEATQVCFSTTKDKQHWFLVQNADIKAVTAPIEASKINSVQINAHAMLVEYSYQKAFKLALFSLKPNYPAWTPKLLHKDSIESGYFEQIQLSANKLVYQRRLKDGEPQIVTIKIEQSVN